MRKAFKLFGIVFMLLLKKPIMEKKDINQPIGGADEKTIEKNLKEMDYPASEDITKQSDELEGDLGNTEE
jgi:hypothetical protein